MIKKQEVDTYCVNETQKLKSFTLFDENSPKTKVGIIISVIVKSYYPTVTPSTKEELLFEFNRTK